MNPTEYEMVGFEYVPMDDIGSAMFLQEQRKYIREHMTKTGGTYAHVDTPGNCMVCGSVNAIYTVLFYHAPTNTYVRMGNDCAQKCEMAYSNGDFDAFKKRITDAREAVAGKRKAKAILEDNELATAWTLYEIDKTPCMCGLRRTEPGEYVPCTCPCSKFKYEERTICDMVGNLVKYGNLSEKQINYIRILVNKINNREAEEARRKAELEAAAPCPSGRIVIEGTVLSVKVDEGGMYGPVTKMLVKHDTGWKVWGTRPSGSNVERGDRVSFTGTVTVSDKDPKFGFYSRPTGCTVLSRVEVV